MASRKRLGRAIGREDHFINELWVLGQEGADEGIAIGVEAIGRDGKDDVALFNLLAIEDFGFFDDADDGAGEDVEAGLEHARLLRRFAADEETVVEAAGFVDRLDELQHDLFLQLATDDAVLHGDGLRADHDDVVNEVVDHVVGDGTGAAVLEDDFLFGAGLFGFHDEDGLFDPWEGGIKEGGE